MNTPERKTPYVGRQLGRALRGFVRQEARVTRWMVGHGMSRPIAASILWIVKLVALAILLYAAFWLALVLVTLLIAAVGAQRPEEDEQPKWLEKDPDDHREDLFYDPLSYNDDPDPRFDDPRHHSK